MTVVFLLLIVVGILTVISLQLMVVTVSLIVGGIVTIVSMLVVIVKITSLIAAMGVIATIVSLVEVPMTAVSHIIVSSLGVLVAVVSSMMMLDVSVMEIVLPCILQKHYNYIHETSYKFYFCLCSFVYMHHRYHRHDCNTNVCIQHTKALYVPVHDHSTATYMYTQCSSAPHTIVW